MNQLLAMNYTSKIYVLFALLFFACDTQKSMDSTNNIQAENTAKVSNQIQLSSKNGFKAMGNEPFWNVEIDFDKQIKFTSLNEPAAFTAPIPKPESPRDAATVNYKATTEKGEIEITIFREVCESTMEDENYAYKVMVSVKTNDMKEFKRYKGCGKYIGNYRLNDNWTLQSINGKLIKDEQKTDQAPNLDLQLNAGKFHGYSGCNSINGKLTFSENYIEFGDIAKTKRMCADMNIENKFTSMLSNSKMEYELEETQLTLRKDKNILIFQKK